MSYRSNKTPAPIKTVPPDVISEARLGGDAYGQNSGRNNPSVIGPGKQMLSPLAANLKSSSGDDVLDSVIAQGAKLPSPQTRNVAPTPFPIAFGCKNPNASNAKIPGADLPTARPPVRQP
jgi:hypothetical protein